MKRRAVKALHTIGSAALLAVASLPVAGVTVYILRQAVEYCCSIVP